MAIPYMSVTIGYVLMAVRGIQAEVIPNCKEVFAKKPLKREGNNNANRFNCISTFFSFSII